MDLTSATGLKRRLAPVSSPTTQREFARSPPHRSPSLSRSSPSSDQSSPSSTSSSPCVNSSVFQNHIKGQNRGSEMVRVSSTSVSLAMSSFSTSKTTFSDSFPRTLLQSAVDYKEEGRKKEMYDPFHPTEGEKDGKIEEDEGEKYDPFEPTGSPASDDDDDNCKITEDLTNTPRETVEEKEEVCPDSSDIFSDPPSPPLATQLSHRRRVDYSTNKARVKRERADSDHSEIEEGEIVVAIERDVGSKRTAGESLCLNSPKITFFDPKPERILRVLDGDGFVSVCADSNWEINREPEDEPVVGVEDLRRKLVSKRKERYLAFPGSSPLASQPSPPPSPPIKSIPSSPLPHVAEKGSTNRKSFKVSKDQNRQRSKDRKAKEKDEKRKKRKKDKDAGQERSREKKLGEKTEKEVRSRRTSRSSSQKRKKTHHSSPEASFSRNSSRREGHSRHAISSTSVECHRERDRERERERDRDRGRDRDRKMERDRHRENEQRCTINQRRDERDSRSRKEERKRKGTFHSSSRERDISKRPRRSRERRETERSREHERERRRDGRPVVPPSIQDLNGSDLFAIKRTITVTTTTTTTTVPGSPILTQASPCRIVEDLDMPHKRKKKRSWHSGGEKIDRGSRHSRSQSLSPPRYHSYESDRYSDKLEIDVLSLDGEALDSDYPSLEDTPPPTLLLDPPVPSPKAKTTPKTERHHPKKKARTSKKLTQSSSSSSSSNKTKTKCLSSLSVTSASAHVSPGLPLAKRARKVGKEKMWDNDCKKDLGRSSRSKKESSSRKGKLQSKVSVMVREGVSSTTGTSVGSGKLGMDLLGPGGTGGSSGGSVVGGSIAVVFCRDNESRSPFLKPCTEPLSVGVRNKDLASMGKRNSLAPQPPSLTSPVGMKLKKTKPGSITSTSSSTSSSSSTLATKRRRRLAKKVREKGVLSSMATEDGGQSKATSESWSGASQEVLPATGDGMKPSSPHSGQAGPAPCSSSSSSSSSSFTSVLPPSSTPPRTPPPSVAPLRDTRESSPDSQTVDSSCKTPEASFLADDCPTQTSPTLPASSPPSPSVTQGSTLTTMQPSSDNGPKSVASPPSSSSSVGGGLGSLSLPLSSSDPSSSSVSSSSASKPPPLPPPAAPVLPWSLQTGVDCTTGGVLALTALLFKMEEANIASRAKAQEFIQATSQILSQANQSQSQAPSAPSLASSQLPPPPPTLPPPPGLSPAQFILQSSLPLVSCTKTPPSHLHPSVGGGCAQTPPPVIPVGLPGFAGSSGDAFWDGESKDPDKYLKKLHTQERAVEEVKLAIKPYYQRKDINKDEYKDILRKAVHKICHSRTGEINPVKVSNLVKLYVQRYKYFRKHGRKMDEEDRDDREQGGTF